jgi:hypothetical protein
MGRSQLGGGESGSGTEAQKLTVGLSEPESYEAPATCRLRCPATISGAWTANTILSVKRKRR